MRIKAGAFTVAGGYQTRANEETVAGLPKPLGDRFELHIRNDLTHHYTGVIGDRGDMELRQARELFGAE